MDGEAIARHSVLERMLLDDSAEPTNLTLSLLQDITKDFSDELQIGRGGFAMVYKGMLGNGMVAVKKLKEMLDIDEKKFNREVECLIGAKHKNIVRFLGYCSDTQGKHEKYNEKFVMADVRHRLLCFKYLPKGSLDVYITDASHGLEWKVRYQIIKGICEGLHYLHQKGIIHLDLKPANILLDDGMVPKIADFGLSRCFDEKQSWTITSKLIGSLGYLAPEFFSGRISVKLDIYSLGVIVMEILTGEKGYSAVEEVVKSWMNRLEICEGDTVPLEQVRVCAQIGTDCMNSDPTKRPVTRHIIERLDKMGNTDWSVETGMSNSSATQAENASNEQHQGTPNLREETSSEKRLLQNITIMEPERLALQLLEEITDNFSEERKIGQGAYGKVYRGEFKNGEEIAVKKLHYVGPGLDDKQFQNEFDSLRKLNHQNIVKLIGYCYETQHRPIEYNGRTIFAEHTYTALCLEYLHNGSLQKHLSDECDGLDWHTRYKIIKGTCEGLKHLHEGFEKPIYHLDLKPDSILLDKNMVPKLAGFGLSTHFSEEQPRITQSPIGTFGYLPPEYIEKNVVSKKLDIFSLGVVMIKIISGPNGRSKSAEMPPHEVIDLVHANWRNRLQTKWSGSSLLEAYCQQVMRCTEIALSCMETDRHKRPNIVDIIQKLNEMETAIDEISRGPGSELLSVEPLQLLFPLGLEPNKSMIACPLHLTNRTDHHVIYRLLITKKTTSEPMKRRVMIKPEIGMVKSLDVHPTEPWILTNGIFEVGIWNYQTQETENLLQAADETRVMAAKFIARKSWFAAGDHDGYIRVHTYDTKQKVKRFKAHTFSVISLDVHRTEPYVLSAGSHDPIKLWDWSKGWECIGTFDTQSISCPVKFNPKDAKKFASASINGLQVWDIGSSCCEFTLTGCESVMECFDYFTRGDQLYLTTVSWDNTVKIWNYQSRTCVQTLKGHVDHVCAVCSHPDLPILATGSIDGTVRLWNSTTFRLEGILDSELGRVTAMAYVKGSRRIVIGFDEGLAMTEIYHEQPGATRSKDHMSSR